MIAIDFYYYFWSSNRGNNFIKLYVVIYSCYSAIFTVGLEVSCRIVKVNDGVAQEKQITEVDQKVEVDDEIDFPPLEQHE